MKIFLYSTKCPKCNVVKLKLDVLKLNYELIEDIDIVTEVGKTYGINSAPILQVDDKYYDFAGAIKFLNGVK